MHTKEVQAKGILQKSGIPGADYVLNPYTGCEHACIYCYARFMKRFTDHKEAWGAFVDAKVNSPELLDRALRSPKKIRDKTIFLSSVTDPYQPAEEQYQLTRKLLERLLKEQAEISILTKSDLVLRDLDLLTQFKSCSVGLSMSSHDDLLAKRIEPRACPPTRRIAALRALREAKVTNYLFLSPYLPAFSSFDSILELTQDCVDEIGIEALNTSAGNFNGLVYTLKKFYPELTQKFLAHVRLPDFWEKLEIHVRSRLKDKNIACMGMFIPSA